MRRNIATIPRYLDILAWRREGKTFQWIADKLQISRQRVWEIHQRALVRVSHTLKKGERKQAA